MQGRSRHRHGGRRGCPPCVQRHLMRSREHGSFVVALLAGAGRMARGRVDEEHRRSQLLGCPRPEDRSRCGVRVACVVERFGDGSAKTLPRSDVLAELLRTAARTPIRHQRRAGPSIAARRFARPQELLRRTRPTHAGRPRDVREALHRAESLVFGLVRHGKSGIPAKSHISAPGKRWRDPVLHMARQGQDSPATSSLLVAG